ncbi:hypothetical protein [Sporosarcina sp. E16_8]|nr:hypothetical protein [Sporosarcina sp. E16_8]MBO0588968.1 hypothetical protein [Sporosarcina sp. E16_8]
MWRRGIMIGWLVQGYARLGGLYDRLDWGYARLGGLYDRWLGDMLGGRDI